MRYGIVLFELAVRLSKPESHARERFACIYGSYINEILCYEDSAWNRTAVIRQSVTVRVGVVSPGRSALLLQNQFSAPRAP